MTIPDAIRENIREALWNAADELGWSTLGDGERARHYERWTRDPQVGGQLAHFMDPRKVRVYIKDTLLKSYGRVRSPMTEAEIWRRLAVVDADVEATYIKPHGRRLVDGRVICWGKSRDWKLIVMALFERANSSTAFTSFAAVLMETGPTATVARRALVSDAATRLGIEHVVWID